MTERPPNWRDLTTRPTAQPTAQNEDFDISCARALSGRDGAVMLERLRDRYFEASQNLAAPEADLRVRATQQQFIRDLESARDRGLAAIKASQKPA